MRERLLEATLECLAERGYANTTTTEVTHRAGVSRGAMLHHYPEKAALVTAAVAYLTERQLDELRQSLGRMPRTQDFVSTALDILWGHFTGPLWRAWLELAVASRTDPELAAHFRPMVARFDRVIAQVADQFFRPSTWSEEEFESTRRSLYYFLQGLALMQAADPDPEEAERALALLKGQIAARVRRLRGE